MHLSKRAAAEFFGTFWLVFGGCGSAVLAAGYTHALGIGFVGVSLAFGLTVLTMAFAIGHISGAHLNPAVSIGLVVGRALPRVASFRPTSWRRCAGAIAGSGVLYVIASGKARLLPRGRLRLERLRPPLAGRLLAAGLLRRRSPAHGLLSCSSSWARPMSELPKGFAPIAIGLALTLIHSDQHPRHQHVRQPRAQPWARPSSSAAGRSSSCGSSGSLPIVGAIMPAASSPTRSSARRSNRFVKPWRRTVLRSTRLLAGIRQERHA